jgi:glycosyltransferase involved in cell wall biosynthesis
VTYYPTAQSDLGDEGLDKAWRDRAIDLTSRLKRALSERYRSSSAKITDQLIGGRSGARTFRRVVIVGPLARKNGVASGARLQWAALRNSGVDTELVDAAPGLRNPLFRARHRAGSAYVVHAGGPQAASLLTTVLPQAASAYRIAYWAWELPDPPPDWTGCERHFDEIWTPSVFASQSLAKLTKRPIHVVPHWVMAQSMRVRDTGKPFTVLAMADSRSSLSRKNPKGALFAFREAFGRSPRARLVLKLHGRRAELDEFEHSCADFLRGGNVEVVRSYLDDGALARLYRDADAFLSLHRAEGFGLPMLEAMANGVPVVATAWSGNLDFMDASDSELVPYSLVPVQDRAGVYSSSLWAEPDIEAAACALRRLADNREHYFRLATAAYQRVLTTSPQFPFFGDDMAVTPVPSAAP